MLRSYLDREQAVFEVDTRRLLDRHGDQVELSHINSGFAGRAYKPAPRGSATFQPGVAFESGGSDCKSQDCKSQKIRSQDPSILCDLQSCDLQSLISKDLQIRKLYPFQPINDQKLTWTSHSVLKRCKIGERHEGMPSAASANDW